MNERPPRIDALEWDDWNLDHIAKHDVTRQEVEEVLASEAMFRDSYKNRIAVTGPTGASRMLTVIIGESPQRPHSYYAFSARPASRNEREQYQREKGGVLL